MSTTPNPLQSHIDIATTGIEQRVLADPGTSFWLKQALEASRGRDPLDALNDASALHAVLAERWLGMEKDHAREVVADVHA
ncbi:hypothetical protein [Pseudoxanthomonas japonensis]|uniref:hypothetical protein n=1 Tax=Pseudoxanthomonas japonensis TaxID=69284 RepID=UPI0037482BAD